MNPSNNRPLGSSSRALGLFAGTILAAAILIGQSAQAAPDENGTWIQLSSGDASGTWDNATTGNWLNGDVADGIGFTADFSTLDITAASTITLGEARTIGNLIFGDTDNTTVARWILDGANPLTLSGATPTITVNNLGTGSLTNSTVTISTVISGSNGLIKDGAGTVATGGNSFARGALVLSGANDYTGGTTISSGTLAAANSSALGTGDVTVANGAQLQIRGVNIANTVNINGANALHSTSSSGSNLSGIVNLQSDSGIKLASNSGNATMTLSGTLNLNGNTLTAQTINVDPAVTISAAINGNSSSGITKVSDGTLRITNDNTTTYSGTTTLQRGHIAIGNDGALGTGTLDFNIDNDATGVIKSTNATARTIANPITFTGGTTGSNVIFGLTSGGTGNLTFTGDVVLNTPSNGNFRSFQIRTRTQFDGDISGDAGITMVSNASTADKVMVLNGNNTYSGATTVNAGTLEVNGSLTSEVTVTAGTLGGSGSTTGAVVIGNNADGSDSFIAPGNSPGTFTTTSSLTLNSDATYQFELDSGTLAADQIVANGITLDSNSQFSFADLGSSAIALSTVFVAIDNTSGSAITGTFLGLAEGATFSSGLNQFQASYVGGTGNDFTLTVVPEPSTFAMLLGGFGMLLGFQRSRRRK